MDSIYWDHYYNHIIALNLAIVVALFAGLRFFSGTIAHIKASDELLKKDNPAFGISLAGATFGITIMLSGTIYGSPENDAVHAAMAVGFFGLAGVALLAVTRLIFDKITLPRIHLRDEIVAGNVAVAIADAGNVIAAAIIIRAVMIWVEVTALDGMLALCGGYVVSQFILTSIALLKRKAFEITHKGHDLQSALSGGNAAVALRFAGQKIGAAFAIATAAHLVVYEEYDIGPILLTWAVASVGAVALWKILCLVAEKVILWRVDTCDEIVVQKNTALGAFLGVIYIAMGMLIAAL